MKNKSFGWYLGAAIAGILAVSLTTANPELREKLMPISKTNPIGELKKAINYFIEKTGKRCTLEAALIGKTNTDKESAKKLIDFARNLKKVILFNLFFLRIFFKHD